MLFLGKSVFSVFAQYWELRFSNRNLAFAAERLQARNLEMPYVEFAQRDTSDMISLQEHALPQAFINGVLQLVILIAEGLTVLVRFKGSRAARKLADTGGHDDASLRAAPGRDVVAIGYLVRVELEILRGRYSGTFEQSNQAMIRRKLSVGHTVTWGK